MTVKKHRSAQQNGWYLPELMDSDGANLPNQDDPCSDRDPLARIFTISQANAGARAAQIAVVMGGCGGQRLQPAMSGKHHRQNQETPSRGRGRRWSKPPPGKWSGAGQGGGDVRTRLSGWPTTWPWRPARWGWQGRR
jgi:hypothetical protein